MKWNAGLTTGLLFRRRFLSLEKETIRKKAVADGTFMKAPNGKDTNLTEDQWLSVRTEAFKNWLAIGRRIRRMLQGGGRERGTEGGVSWDIR